MYRSLNLPVLLILSNSQLSMEFNHYYGKGFQSEIGLLQAVEFWFSDQEHGTGQCSWSDSQKSIIHLEKESSMARGPEGSQSQGTWLTSAPWEPCWKESWLILFRSPSSSLWTSQRKSSSSSLTWPATGEQGGDRGVDSSTGRRAGTIQKPTRLLAQLHFWPASGSPAPQVWLGEPGEDFSTFHNNGSKVLEPSPCSSVLSTPWSLLPPDPSNHWSYLLQLEGELHNEGNQEGCEPTKWQKKKIKSQGSKYLDQTLLTTTAWEIRMASQCFT